MANPGYPMQPQPPMGMPPQQMAPNGPRPVRRGTSKAVPVIMSAGLAVGVFCGLLFGLGTGEQQVAVADTTEAPKKDTPKADVAEPKAPEPAKPTVPDKPAEPDKPAVAAGSGSGSPPVADAGSGSGAPAAGSGATPAAGSAAPAAKNATLVVVVTPEGAASAAKISIDGKESPAKAEIDMGDAAKKKVAVVIKADGYKDARPQTIEVEAGAETKFEINMIKKPRPGGGLPRPDTGSIKPKKDPKDGKIDI